MARGTEERLAEVLALEIYYFGKIYYPKKLPFISSCSIPASLLFSCQRSVAVSLPFISSLYRVCKEVRQGCHEASRNEEPEHGPTRNERARRGGGGFSGQSRLLQRCQ
jgi:hypothetical protein